MNTNSSVYAQLNKAWKSTCRILLGEEIGELKEYEEWLKEYMPVIGKRKSHISGKDVTVAFDEYCKDANFVSLDEVKEKSIEPLTINEIKDIDSIVEAISERWEYTGNKILGNSSFVESSDTILESQYVFGSIDISQSTHIFNGALVRTNSKYIFGSPWLGQCEFLIRVIGATNVKRGFESSEITDCSDIYFSHNCHGSHELMFCFNQRSKRYCVGNLQLSKDKYLSLKAKLIKEVVEELKKEKRFPSLFALVQDKMVDIDLGIQISQNDQIEQGDIKPIEKAFSSTFKILFKREPDELSLYEKWLSRSFPAVYEIDTLFGSKTFATDFIPRAVYPKKRIVTVAEAEKLSRLHLEEKDIETLDTIKNSISKIAFFPGEVVGGINKNVIKGALRFDCFNTYKVYTGVSSEYCGIDFMTMQSKYVFGCYRILHSEFCIDCHNSLNLNRCFELDSCENCSDTHFAHNCEGLQDAMFCWNAKGKRYAIGNAQLQPEQYRKIKDILIEQMADEILKKKELRYDIFNIGCYNK